MDPLARLDRFVHVTRLDFLTAHARRPAYSFRWLPLVALAMLAGGYALVVMAARYGAPFRAGVAGAGLFVTGMMIAVILMFVGPRFRDTNPNADEREREIESRAGDLAGRIIGVAAALACFYLAAATWLETWMPEQPFEWSTLGCALLVVPRLLRIWVAGWLQPRFDDED
jgi:hypothetical protein